MIDINKAKQSFKDFLTNYKNQDKAGFNLKVVHTYYVVDYARLLAQKLNLNEEDILLAELIGLLHDIGRFEELNVTKKFDNTSFDHAGYGVKMLFEDNMIRNFIKTNEYDSIIKKAISNHSKLHIENNLSQKELLHAKIIRDADKIDNFRVKTEEAITTIFPGSMNDKKELETATLSDKVYASIKSNQCVNVYDRKTLLDYWVCILGFIFDLNFKESYIIVKENDYVNKLVDRFTYKDEKTTNQMEEIREIINNYVNEKIGEKNE